MNMIKSLENFLYGFENTKSFEASVINHRLVNLDLSKYSTLEPFHTGGIKTLDSDRIEERYLLSGAKDGALCIHDLHNTSGKASYTAKLVSKIPKNALYSHKYSIDTVQWYPFDTGLFVTSGMDSVLKIWDTNAMEPAEVFNMPHKINCHHMSPASNHHSLIAVTMESPNILLLDPKSGSYSHQLRGHSGVISCARWSASCEYLLASGGMDKILLWDVRSAKSFLHSLDQDNVDVIGRQKDLSTAHNGLVNGLCFTNDGLHLVSCGTDHRIRLWDVALGKNSLVNFGRVVNSHYTRCTMDICCDSNPPVLFFPSANYVLAFDLFSGCKIKNLVGHFSIVNCCIYRSSTNQVFSGGNDLNILMWTPDTQQEVDEETEVQTSKIEHFPSDSDNWSSDSEQ